MEAESAFPIKVSGAGAVTSVGFDLASTTAAIEAGIDGFQETQFIDDAGQPVLGAPIPAESPAEQASGVRVGGSARQARCVAMAIEEALDGAGIAAKRSDETGLVFIPPENSPASISTPEIRTATTELLGSDIFSHRHRVAPGGAVTIAQALRFAQSWIAEDSDRTVVIAAFDSWLNVPGINLAISQQRLLDSASSDGLIPGEAASAIVLQSGQTDRTGTNLQILGIGIENEEVGLHSNRLGTGVALGKAIKRALQQAGFAADQVQQRLANVSGEEYFFTESSYAWTRILRKVLPPEYRYQLISSSIGDVGSAFGPLVMGYAMQSCQDFRLSNDKVLFQMSSAGAPRCAIVGQVMLAQPDSDEGQSDV